MYCVSDIGSNIREEYNFANKTSVEGGIDGWRIHVREKFKVLLEGCERDYIPLWRI